MAITTRSGSITTRGGGSGGGSITVNDHTGEAISTGVRTIEWQTLDKYGFTATVDPDDPTKVIIGDAPVFEPKIVFSPTPTTQVRVSQSDPAEPDAFSDGGWANSVQPATANSMPWFNSTLGRGFGADARLRVVVQWDDTVVEDQTFPCVANGGQVTNGLTVVIANLEPDGDGSADKARINVNVDLMSYLPYPQSAKFTVGFQFTEHKWAETVLFSQTFFFDKDGKTPVIDGTPSVREHDDPSQRVIKYLSGIGYYDLGSLFTITTPDINQFNEDTSHPTAGLSIDASNFGIALYTSSPWQNGVQWSNVGNLDTSPNFGYEENRAVDVPNFRHCATATVGNVVRDNWNDSANVNSNQLRVLIDTHNRLSTPLIEYFDSENMRLSSDYVTPWDSTKYCVGGEAIVFGGRLYQGSDLPRITENVSGALGTMGSMTTFLPNERADGTSRQNPSYTGHVRDGVFFRRFFSSNGTKASFNMNIISSGDIGAQLRNGDIKIYIWKSGSTNPNSPNIVLPPAYNPTNGALSLGGSIWLHGANDYNFGTFTDGAAQTNADATCRSKVTGTTVEGTFGGNDLVENGSILVRFEVVKGHWLEEVSVTFK